MGRRKSTKIREMIAIAKVAPVHTRVDTNCYLVTCPHCNREHRIAFLAGEDVAEPIECPRDGRKVVGVIPSGFGRGE